MAGKAALLSVIIYVIGLCSIVFASSGGQVLAKAFTFGVLSARTNGLIIFTLLFLPVPWFVHAGLVVRRGLKDHGLIGGGKIALLTKFSKLKAADSGRYSIPIRRLGYGVLYVMVLMAAWIAYAAYLGI